MDIINQLLKENFRPETGVVTNLPKSCIVFRDTSKFLIESELSLEDKIKIIDSHTDMTATYLLNLIKLYNNDKTSFDCDECGNYNVSAVNKWMKKNDTKKICSRNCSPSKEYSYYFIGRHYSNLSMITPTSLYGHYLLYTGEHIVNQWFYDLLLKLKKEETDYFKTHDPIQIKLKKLSQYANNYNTCFDNELLFNIAYNPSLIEKEKEVKEEVLDVFLNAYEELETTIKQISEKVGKISF